MKYHVLDEIESDGKSIAGKKVLVRLDLNVPVQNNLVVDDFRIVKALPTIEFLLHKKAKVIIISHIEGGTDTLKPVFEVLQKKFSAHVSFCTDCIEEGGAHIEKMQPGEVLLCENLRLYDGEKKNDSEFAKKIASLGEVYVNDAFSVSHRKHASIVGIPKLLPHFMGLQFQKEVENLSKVFNPPQPFLFMLGGAKFSTKMPLIEKFLPLVETLFVGGALANDVMKAQGLEVGNSLVSDTDIDLTSIAMNKKVIVPLDVVVHSDEGGASDMTVSINEVTEKEVIMDCGQKTVDDLNNRITSAACVLWNGPTGNYEKGYTKATEEIARAMADSKGLTIVGGGDTLAAISKLGIEDKFSFISTGGGAMLDYLANETLPGLEALEN